MGLSGPVPARVPAEVKELVLATVDDAVAGGYSHRWATGLWPLDRVHRWRARRRDGDLGDRPPGAARPEGPIACWAGRWRRSWRSPSSGARWTGPIASSPTEDPTSPGCGSHRRRFGVFSLLTALSCPNRRRSRAGRARRGRTGWCGNRTGSGSTTSPTSASPGIVDMVSRRWIATLASTEETSTQVRVVFDTALIAEGLDELLTDRLDLDADDPDRPILLAVSDNGPAMTSTGAYMTLIHRPAPRPAAHPHRPGMDRVSGPTSARSPTQSSSAELARVRDEYNTVASTKRSATYPRRRTPPSRRTHPRGPPARPATSPPTTARPQPPDHNNHTRQHPETRLITNPDLRGRLRHTSNRYVRVFGVSWTQ